MAQVYVSMGSNNNPIHHLRVSLNQLGQYYGKIQKSSLYESPAVGIKGDNFYNLVARFTTDTEVHTLVGNLRKIERNNGRHRGADCSATRTIDIDLLLYDNLVIQEDSLVIPRIDITHYAFVLLPLAEIAPTERHPITRQRYADMWEVYAKTRHPDIKRLELDFP